MKLYDFRVVPTKRGSLRTARKLKRLVALDAPPVDEKSRAEIFNLNQRETIKTNGDEFAAAKVL